MSDPNLGACFSLPPRAGAERTTDHASFEIGMKVECGDVLWRCTDIGSRTVTPIRVDRVEWTSKNGDVIAKSTLSRSEA